MQRATSTYFKIRIQSLLVLISLLSFALSPLSHASAQSPKPLSPSTIALLYDGDRDPVSGESGFVTSIASWRNFLYASWHDLDQRYYLHIWDVQDPRSPVQVDSIYFGQGVDTPSLKFEPKGLHVHNGHLVLGVRNQLVVYPLSNNGRLGEALEFSFPDGIDSNVLRLSHGGNFASTLRTTISDDDYLDAISGPNGVHASVLDEYLSAQVFINLRKPTEPFLQRLHRPYGIGYQSFYESINGTYRGNPLIATLSNDNTSVSLTTFTDGASNHLQGFWNSKLPYLFNQGALNKPLSALIKGVVRELDTANLQERLLQLYGRNLRINLQRKVSANIRAKWAPSTTLESVLTEYGIDADDSLRKAVGIILESQVSDSTTGALERQVYAAALAAWHQKVFAFRNSSLARVASSISSKMNAELSEAGAAKYFVKRVLSPLLGNPEYLNYTISDLLQAIASSGFSGTIDALLTTFHTVLPVSDFLTAPDCFQIPQSTNGLLTTAFIDNGPKLSRNGLAAYEIIRLALYYSGGNPDTLQSDIGTKVRDFHSSLSSDLVRTIFGSLGALDDLNQKQLTLAKSFAANADVRDVITSPLVGTIEALLKRRGVNFDHSVKDSLEAQGLYLGVFDAPFGESQSTTVDLASKLESLGLGQLSVQTLLERAQARRPSALDASIEALLTHHARTVFGAVLPSTTLKQAALSLILKRLDPAVTGAFISGTLNTLLRSRFGDVSSDPDDAFRLRGVLGRVSLAAQGDCISQWELALGTAAALAEGSVFGAGLAPFFLSAQEAVYLAAEESVESILSIMLGELTSSIFTDAKKDYASWHSRLTSHVNTIDLTQLRPANLELAKVVPFTDKIGIFMHDQGFFSVEDPRVYLALVSIASGTASTVVHELGNWSEIHGVRSVGDFLLIDGELIKDGSSSHQIKIYDVRTSTPRGYLVSDPDLEVAFQFKQAVEINNGQQLAVMLDAPSEVLFIDLY